MPLRYKIIEPEKLVYVVGEGDITHSELIAHLEELSKDERYKAPMKKLVDYRQASPLNPTSLEMDDFINKMKLLEDIFKGEICAIVLNFDLSFGISRVYEAKKEPSQLEVNVFRDFNEALKWLEVQVDENEITEG